MVAPSRLAFMSMHTAPGLASLGHGDSGGLNLVVLRLCEQLGRRGVQTDIFTRDDGSGPAEEWLFPYSRLVRISAGPTRALPKTELVRWIDDFASGVEEFRAREDSDYSLLHSHFWLSGLAAKRLSWPIPRLQSFHSLARAKAGAGLPLDEERARAEQELVSISDCLITNSRAEASDLIQLYGALSSKIAIAYPAADRVSLDAELQAVASAIGMDRGRWLLFAGRLDPVKGLEVLLHALTKLPPDVNLCVIGDESSEGAAEGQLQALRNLADRLQILSRVEFRQALPHNELARYYAASSLCIMPSFSETFGIVALEAQAAGTPVVASAVGGLCETVRDGITGKLVAPGNANALAQAIADLLKNPQKMAAMSLAAKQHAAGFSWERTADSVLEAYTRLAANSPINEGMAGTDNRDLRPAACS